MRGTWGSLGEHALCKTFKVRGYTGKMVTAMISFIFMNLTYRISYRLVVRILKTGFRVCDVVVLKRRVF